MILTGDLNVAYKEIDIYDPTNKEKTAGYTPQERHSIAKLLNNGFTDTFRHLYPDKVQYTFWSMRQRKRPSNEGWRLDYFILSRHVMHCIIDSEIHNEYWGSDHCPISFTFDTTKIDLAQFVE